jgi:hypothetical protein
MAAAMPNSCRAADIMLPRQREIASPHTGIYAGTIVPSRLALTPVRALTRVEPRSSKTRVEQGAIVDDHAAIIEGEMA